MNQLSNIELCTIFKICKNRLVKEPDFDIVELVASKLETAPNEKLMYDVKEEMEGYKAEQKNRSSISSDSKVKAAPCLL